MNPPKPTKLRTYFMALLGRRRTPIRIPQAEIQDTISKCREWWVVEAPSALAARKLCLRWPRTAIDGETGARITNHGNMSR